MEKDKDWLSEQVGDLNSTDAVFYESGISYIDTAVSIERVFDLINQLDEPEVLSQEWIENKKWQACDPDARTLYWAVTETDLENLLVPNQELPVIPKYVADWIYDLKNKEINMLESIYDFTHGEDINDYMREKGNVLMRAWLDGFTVEKEPKYCVVLPEITGSAERYLVKANDSGNLWIDGGLGYIKRVEDVSYKFTEQEIKEFDDRYWAFAVPVEEVE